MTVPCFTAAIIRTKIEYALESRSPAAFSPEPRAIGGQRGLVRRAIRTIAACHAFDQRGDVVRVAVAEESGAGFSAAVDRRVPSLRLRDVADKLDFESPAAGAAPRPRMRTGKGIEVNPNRIPSQILICSSYRAVRAKPCCRGYAGLPARSIVR